MKNQSYSVEQLIADDSFLAYVLRTDPEAVRAWESWIIQHPEQRAVADEAVRIIHLMAIRQETVSEADIQSELERFEAALADAPVVSLSPGTRNVRQTAAWSWWTRIAASLVLLLVAALTVWVLVLGPAAQVAYQTGAGESRLLVLPDSSLVYLGESSTLRHPRYWWLRTSREVWLEGDAFFHVKPKPAEGGVKFLVHASQATVEVLGTRFNVWNRNRQTRVVLNSGKVKLSRERRQQTDAIYMEPGDMVELAAEDARPLKTRVAVPDAPPQKGNKIVFDNSSIREVALVVEEYYGLRLRIQDQTIEDLRITGTLPTNNEASFLKALSVVLNLEVVKESDRDVLLKSNQ
jgi:transmembrane sensor